MQGGPAVVIDGVDSHVVVQQQLDHLPVSVGTGDV